MPGLLIDGVEHQVDKVNIVNQGDDGWAKLAPGDCTRRLNLWVRQWILHKTIADDPEVVMPGGGMGGGAMRTTENWQEEFAGSHRYAGAHLVTDFDGTVACLADLLHVETFHATVSNPWSVGHETCELRGGGFYQASLDATVQTCWEGCPLLGIQLQIPTLGSYTGHPIPRMLNGGSDMVGIFGHRDNTESRGRWDPGDVFFQCLATRGAEQFDFAAGEDKDVWGRRQKWLNEVYGSGLTEDGVPGPSTTKALEAAGYDKGIWVLGKAA